MSQRTRIRTTGAATPPPSEPSSAQSSEHAKRRTRRNGPDNVGSAGNAKPGNGLGHGLGLGSLGPEHLARALRAVASELERDPALAQRVSEAVYAPTESSQHNKQVDPDATPSAVEPGKKAVKRVSPTFTPRVVEGMSATLGTGILDPFAVRAASGEEGLRAALAELRLGSLRAIVREHQLDPSGAAVRGNDAEKLRMLILAASREGGAKKQAKNRTPGG